MAARLRSVPTQPDEQPDTSYEWRDRKRIAERDWAALHRRSDASAAIFIPDRVKRLWR